MNVNGFGYHLPDGGYAVEGFVFRLKGKEGEIAVTPDHLLGIPVRKHENNWVRLRVAIDGKGVHSERFLGEVVLLDGPASVLSRFVTDIERLRSGELDVLTFPSAQEVEFQSSCFQCTIARDKESTTGWSMLCRCATPSWWAGDSPPRQDDCERVRFAATFSLLMELDPDSMDVLRSDVIAFLFWLGRQSGTNEEG